MIFMSILTSAARSQDTSEAARQFIQEHERNIKPLEIEIGRAWWTANISGRDEDFAAKSRRKISSTMPWPIPSSSSG